MTTRQASRFSWQHILSVVLEVARIRVRGRLAMRGSGVSGGGVAEGAIIAGATSQLSVKTYMGNTVAWIRLCCARGALQTVTFHFLATT